VAREHALELIHRVELTLVQVTRALCALIVFLRVRIVLEIERQQLLLVVEVVRIFLGAVVV
jgi:hypothetical protein